MTKAELDKIIAAHAAWLRGEGGERADLRNADLRNADLCSAVLCGAVLRGADLCNANLCSANLYGADLCDTYNNERTAFYALACPEKGQFTGFKKCGRLIVELCIPADARRSSATTRKCRCDKAEVVSITNLDGSPAKETEVASGYDRNFVYRVGETVAVDNFCTDRWAECAAGIHFFITRDEAVRYQD